jgi:hypothetical protein
MLVKAQMVPLPVRAGEKFHEAIYFFNRMVQTQTNVALFPFHFSAFLSALRSVTFYLQAQFKGNTSFEVWYQQKQQELRNDPLMRMLKEMRDEALHARPIELQFWHGPKLPSGGIVTKHFEFSMDTDDQGEVRTKIKVGEDGQEQNVPPIVRWVVDLPDEIDILPACDQSLQKMKSMLEEWEHQSKAAV